MCVFYTVSEDSRGNGVIFSFFQASIHNSSLPTKAVNNALANFPDDKRRVSAHQTKKYEAIA